MPIPRLQKLVNIATDLEPPFGPDNADGERHNGSRNNPSSGTNNNNPLRNQSTIMFSKPVFIAAVLTLVAAVPLYLFDSANLSLDIRQLPWQLLGVFTLLVTATLWSGGAMPVKNDSRQRVQEQPDRERGMVKWFNSSKGFGFITSDDGEDVFVHFHSIRGRGHRTLRDGQRVDFIVSEGEKGLQAEDVAVAR